VRAPVNRKARDDLVCGIEHRVVEGLVWTRIAVEKTEHSMLHSWSVNAGPEPECVDCQISRQGLRMLGADTTNRRLIMIEM